ALPLPEKELQAEVVDGKWQLRQAGYPANLSIAEQRREWLRTQGKVAPDALLTMADVQHGNVPSPHAKRSRLVVFDDLIDKVGQFPCLCCTSLFSRWSIAARVDYSLHQNRLAAEGQPRQHQESTDRTGPQPSPKDHPGNRTRWHVY